MATLNRTSSSIILTIKTRTATAMRMTEYQCVTRKLRRLSMLSSDSRILRRVASGPEGST